MIVIRRNNATGIDEVIDRIQTRLNSELGFPDDFSIFDRAYKTEDLNGVNLERFIGGKDYKDVFRSDKTSGHIVFFQAEESSIVKNSVDAVLSVFCFANLQKLYPTIAHRADSELHNALYSVLRYYHPVKIVHGFEALRGYDVKLQDMHPWHVCRFDLKVNYSLINIC